MAEFTDGPWTIEESKDDPGKVRVMGNGYSIAGRFRAGIPIERANAQLIAAAPDLYWALVRLLSHFGGDVAIIREGTLEEARQALLKAGARSHDLPIDPAPEPGPTERVVNPLLSSGELKVLELLQEATDIFCTEVVFAGPNRDPDVHEWGAVIHQLQAVVLSQAGARAYPQTFRLLGDSL